MNEILILFLGVVFILLGSIFMFIFGIITCCWLFFDGDEVIDRIETDVQDLERLLK